MEKEMVIGNHDGENSKLFNQCVINGAGWSVLKTQDEFALLKQIHNESKGTRHTPLQHWDGIQMFNDRMVASNVAVKSDIGMLSPNRQKFVYMAEVTDSIQDDLSFFLGFISFNDKSRSVSTVCGTTVFVCSNLTFSGIDKEFRQKHLSKVHDGTVQVFDHAISKFNEFRDNRLAQINRMKEIEIDRNMQGNLMLDMMHSEIFGRDPMLVSSINRQFEKPIHDEFTDRSLWHFQNAATEEMKKIGYASRIKTDEELDRILGTYIER